MEQQPKPGAEEYELGKQYERAGDLERAVLHYKRAERLGHDLEDDVDPSEYFAYASSVNSDALRCADESEEREDDLRLEPEIVDLLARHPHALDYQFSEEQRQFLEKNGYLVIKRVVPASICDEMIRECFERAHRLLGVIRPKHETWTPLTRDGFIDIWHNPAYYKIRQIPTLYSIFAQLLRNPKLTVSLDRTCMKTPAFVDVPSLDDDGATFSRVTFEQAEFPIHTDMNLWYLQETKYQCGIAMDDCPVGAGGFRCVPGFHKLEHIRQYRRNFESGKYHYPQQNNSTPATAGTATPKVRPPSPDSVFEWFMDEDWKKKAIEIPLEKGDIVVWNSRLPHSNTPNHSERWRVHAYVRFVPADESHELYRREVAKAAQSGEKPKYYSTGNSTSDYNNKWEMEGYQLPELSELGKRLLGLESWDTL